MKVNLDEGIDKGHLMTQLEFRKAIAMAWIDPDSIASKKESVQIRKISTNAAMDGTVSMSTSTITMDSWLQKRFIRRAADLNTNTLVQNSAQSRIRLDTTMDHYQSIGRPNVRCQLHKWLGMETEKHVYHCPNCNGNLCIECHKIYHTIPDIISKKHALQNRYKIKK